MNVASLLDPLRRYRLYIEIGLVIAVISIGISWWHEHNLKEQTIGKAQCEQGVAAAREQGQKIAEQTYVKQLKDRQDVIDQYAKDKADADHRHDLDTQQLRNYKDRLRASATKGPSSTPGDTGPEIVRFTLQSYESFTDTCKSVADDGLADALALKLCKAYVDKLPHEPP